MLCECGGVLLVVRVEKTPADKKSISYARLCDVECAECGKKYYSQPYDFGTSINPVRKIED